MIDGTIKNIRWIFDDTEDREKVQVIIELYPIPLTAPHTNEPRGKFRQRLQRQIPDWSMLNNLHLGHVKLDQEVNEVNINDIVSEFYE